MKIAIYPGSFDPVTNGHLDILERASSLFDEVVICVARNSTKSPIFSAEERTELIEQSLSDIQSDSNIAVDILADGLLVDYAAKKNAVAIIRGLRGVSDFDYEFQMALTNRRLKPAVSSIFFMPGEKYTYLNSSIVREIASLNGDISHFVPPVVADALRKKFNKK